MRAMRRSAVPTRSVHNRRIVETNIEYLTAHIGAERAKLNWLKRQLRWLNGEGPPPQPRKRAMAVRSRPAIPRLRY